MLPEIPARHETRQTSRSFVHGVPEAVIHAFAKGDARFICR
jgi:hypothetical protein